MIPPEILGIEDRIERLRAVCYTLTLTRKRAQRARAARDMAAVVAHLDHGVQPVVLWKGALGVSRGMFARTLRKAPAQRPTMKDPVRTATGKAAEARALAAEEDELIAYRDDLMLALMDGIGDDGEPVEPVRNSVIAKIAGVSTARAAQVRHPAAL